MNSMTRVLDCFSIREQCVGRDLGILSQLFVTFLVQKFLTLLSYLTEGTKIGVHFFNSWLSLHSFLVGLKSNHTEGKVMNEKSQNTPNLCSVKEECDNQETEALTSETSQDQKLTFALLRPPPFSFFCNFNCYVPAFDPQ